MKKFLLFIMIFISTIQRGYCATEAIGSELSGSLKVHSHEPGIMSIVLALMFVLCLIYGTGIIYSKLNIAGAKAVKKQLENQDLTGVVVLSTTQLGQGKNLHVIEVNNQRLLIGATPSSIHLIKELEKKQEADADTITKSEKPSVAEEEKFDVHKKYL